MLPHDEVTTTSSFSIKDGKMIMEPPRRRISRRHSVGFQPDTDMQVIEFDMIDEEVREVFWYSREEYDIIKARNSLIVKMMKTGHFKESDEHTFRGLEHKLKEGFKQRRSNKYNGLNAVLEEQDRQYARGVTKPEDIAEKYGRVAMVAAETAMVVAMRDFKNSYCYSVARQSLPNHHAALNGDDQGSAFDDMDTNRDFRPRHPTRSGYDVDDDTIASMESTASKTRTRIQSLFSAVSMAKRKEGKMNRRSSM